MAEELPEPPFIYEGFEAIPPKDADRFGTHALKSAVGALVHAVDVAKRPGMPLGVLSNAVREAPLGALFIAFVAGMVVARRR